MVKKRIPRRVGKPPKMCTQYLGDDSKGREIYCNQWLNDKGICPIHGKKA
jgi:hypothetical protein